MWVTITKKIEKKVPFDMYHENFGNYIIREVTNTSDIVCVVGDIKYPI